jgi:hypothetical protein
MLCSTTTGKYAMETDGIYENVDSAVCEEICHAANIGNSIVCDVETKVLKTQEADGKTHRLVFYCTGIL